MNSLIPPPPTQLGAPGVSAAVLFMLNRDAVAPDDVNGRQVGVVPLLPSAGQFEISNVLPGVYELLARVADPAAQVAGGLPLAWGRARFEVRDMDVTNLSIVVAPSSEVSGTLVAANGAKLPPSLRVQLLPDDASIRVPAFQAVLTRSAMVGPDGTFKDSGRARGTLPRDDRRRVDAGPLPRGRPAQGRQCVQCGIRCSAGGKRS